MDELEQNVTNWLGSLPPWTTLRPRIGSAVSVEQAKKWLHQAVQNILADDVLGVLLSLDQPTMTLWRDELGCGQHEQPGDEGDPQSSNVGASGRTRSVVR